MCSFAQIVHQEELHQAGHETLPFFTDRLNIRAPMREREREWVNERERECVCVRARVCMYACVHACASFPSSAHSQSSKRAAPLPLKLFRPFLVVAPHFVSLFEAVGNLGKCKMTPLFHVCPFAELLLPPPPPCTHAPSSPCAPTS